LKKCKIEASDITVKKEAKEKKQVPKVTKTKKIQKRRRKAKKGKRMCEKLKNIVKNYGKNCALFSISPEGKPYIGDQLSEEEYTRFKDFVQVRIPNLINIPNFREMLLESPVDCIEICKFKKLFRDLSEIFINYFSLNWIFHSPRIKDVKGHIILRHKMLRRVREPEHFTYIH